MRRHVSTTALVALALAALAGAATRSGPVEPGQQAGPADGWQQGALVDLRRVRLEQTLIRAERTAVMLGELFVLRPTEGRP